MKNHDHYRPIIENIPAVTWTSNREGHTFFISPNIEELYGYTPQEIYDHGDELWFGRIHKSDYEKVIQSFSELFTKNKSFCIDYRIQCKDGRWIWIRDKASKTFKENGVELACGILYDITDYKEMAIKLEESQRRFRDLSESSTDWIWEFDENCVFTYSSPSVTQLLGYLPEEIVGMSAFDIIPPPEKEQVAKEFAKIRDKHKAFSHLENLNLHKDGHRVILESSGTPIFDKDGLFRGYRGIDRNISERKRVGQQMAQKQKTEAIGTLAGGIAHDFNNILAIIIGFTELARKRLPEESPVAENLDEVLSAGSRARSLVEQILNFSSKRSSGKQAIPLTPLVDEVASFMRATLPSSIIIQETGRCENDFILADPTQIHQVLINLCTNAAHAMEAIGGTISITVSNAIADEEMLIEHPEAEDKQFIKLSIADTGGGINPHIIPKLFDPYFTTKKQGKGTGLGLAVVRGIASSHDGFITVDNDLGVGATFNIFLPVTEQAHDNRFSDETHEPPMGTGHILLVDDEEAIVTATSVMLEDLGYTVTAETDSQVAIKKFEENPALFDLIITDLTMPFLKGDKLAAYAIELRPDIPVIICSGFNNEDNQEDSYLGIKHLNKPTTYLDLATAVHSALSQ